MSTVTLGSSQGKMQGIDLVGILQDKPARLIIRLLFGFVSDCQQK